MASVAVILLMGRLYDIFNTKWLMNISTAIFEIGSAICGAAPSSNALIVGRVIAGIGGSGMYLGLVQISLVESWLLTWEQGFDVFLRLHDAQRSLVV